MREMEMTENDKPKRGRFLTEEQLARIGEYAKRGIENLTKEEQIDLYTLLGARELGEELADMGIIPPLESDGLPPDNSSDK